MDAPSQTATRRRRDEVAKMVSSRLETPPPSRQRPPNGVTRMRPRPSMRGGRRAKGRDLGAQGLQTLKRLLEAGLAEFCDKGYQAVRVEDIVLRAKTSHGTFYLYFESKDDLFSTLLRDVLQDMTALADDFPVFTSNEVGENALRAWVARFCGTYAAHAAVIRIVSQAEIVSEEVWQAGLDVLQRLARSIAQGMTAARSALHPYGPGAGDGAELTAVACVTMLERINYLLSVGVQLPAEEITDRIAEIIVAAFRET